MSQARVNLPAADVTVSGWRLLLTVLLLSRVGKNRPSTLDLALSEETPILDGESKWVYNRPTTLNQGDVVTKFGRLALAY